MNDEVELYRFYINSIQKYALLTSLEEEELSKKIEAGDKKALCKMVNSNLRLVVCIAKKFSSSYKFSTMDLIQEGNMGLMAAAQKYHYSFNTRFSTYAYTWIFQYMLRFVHNKTAMIEIPHRKEELLRQISSAQVVFNQKYGRNATAKELSSFLEIDEAEIADALSCAYSYSSLDVECNDESGETVGELFPDRRFNPEDIYIENEAKGGIADLLKLLPEKERIVIFNRYNFARRQRTATLRELGESLGVSTETVRQIELRAVKHLQKVCEGDMSCVL
ncbi:MAG: sigma-70 family RNA polymerase sigma factor [Treponema sp.]|nr:sigma-70 family RNA polymerase sigma factor [Treponema sp.]